MPKRRHKKKYEKGGSLREEAKLREKLATRAREKLAEIYNCLSNERQVSQGRDDGGDEVSFFFQLPVYAEAGVLYFSIIGTMLFYEQLYASLSLSLSLSRDGQRWWLRRRVRHCSIILHRRGALSPDTHKFGSSELIVS